MPEPFDAFEYVEYLRRGWRVLSVSCAVALLLALGVSLMLPKRYTATASIVIEPPGGNDVRTATAVSPVYLESLRTYERFASSDTLFVRAVEQFHLQQPSQTIESLKQQVLKVSKLRDTKILELSVTLRDPKLAQAVVQFLAEETVNLSRGENRAADREIVDEASKQESEARRRLEQAQAAWGSFAGRDPVEALRAEIDSNVSLSARLREELVEDQAEIAEYSQPNAHANPQAAGESLNRAKARTAALGNQIQELRRSIEERSSLLSRRTAEREKLQTDLQIAQTAYESTAAHLRDTRATAGARGERLRVIDPGIVPQRPSSPNVALNILGALCFALVASVVFLSLTFVYRRRPTADFEHAIPGRRRG